MLTTAAFLAGVGLCWLCYRGDTRPVTRSRTYVVPALAARTHRATWRLHPGDIPDRPWTDWLPSTEVAANLAAWDAEVGGLPFGYAATFAPADVRLEVDEHGATIGRIIPERPSTAMVRRIASETAA